MPTGVYEHKPSQGFKKGRSKIPWNKGLKIDRKKYPKIGHFNLHGVDTRAKMKANHKGTSGKKFSDESREKMSAWQKNKPRLKFRGEDHWNWKGGISKERHVAMGRQEYKQWRSDVFQRDDWTCQTCHARGVYLEAHHLNSWKDYPELRYVVDNGVTLCLACHKLTFANKGDQSNQFLGK